jgi:hypothetical protein
MLFVIPWYRSFVKRVSHRGPNGSWLCNFKLMKEEIIIGPLKPKNNVMAI